MERHDHGRDDGGPGEELPCGYGPGGEAAPGGLSVSANGLLHSPSETRVRPGTAREWTFRVLDEAGTAVTDCFEVHDAMAHLILVRRDLVGFQHLHPRLDEEGTWRVAGLTIPEPGVYRAFVDVAAGGHSTTLGYDLFAPGLFEPAPRPGSSRRAEAGEYEVELLDGDVPVGSRSTLAFDVRRAGAPVEALEPHLGALGPLVAVGAGDLAYLHVHPLETEPGSGRVEFGARSPSRGRYRLFLQARPDGELITTSFDVPIDG